MVVRPTNVMLFEDVAGSDALAILALTTVFHTLGVTSRHSAGDGEGDIAGAQPAGGRRGQTGSQPPPRLLVDIRGAAVATLIAYAAATLLNLAAFRGQLGRMFRLRRKRDGPWWRRRC